MRSIPVGLSVREPWIEGLLSSPRHVVDLIELIVDDSIEHPCLAERWAALGRRWPVVAHGVGLGIGNAEGVSESFVRAVGVALHGLGARWYGEHLAFNRTGDVELDHFGPLDAEPDTLAAIERNAEVVRRHCGVPLLLENPADVIGLLDEGADAGVARGHAYMRALEVAGAGALLDVTNLLLDSRNGGWAPQDFLGAIDCSRIVEVHVAGGERIDGLWIDTHGRAIEAESLALLSEVVRRAPNLRAIVLERDSNIPALHDILREVDLIRATVRTTLAMEPR